MNRFFYILFSVRFDFVTCAISLLQSRRCCCFFVVFFLAISQSSERDGVTPMNWMRCILINERYARIHRNNLVKKKAIIGNTRAFQMNNFAVRLRHLICWLCVSLLRCLNIRDIIKYIYTYRTCLFKMHPIPSLFLICPLSVCACPCACVFVCHGCVSFSPLILQIVAARSLLFWLVYCCWLSFSSSVVLYGRVGFFGTQRFGY